MPLVISDAGPVNTHAHAHSEHIVAATGRVPVCVCVYFPLFFKVAKLEPQRIKNAGAESASGQRLRVSVATLLVCVRVCSCPIIRLPAAAGKLEKQRGDNC